MKETERHRGTRYYFKETFVDRRGDDVGLAEAGDRLIRALRAPDRRALAEELAKVREMTENPRFRPSKPYRLLMGWVHLAWFGMGWGVGALTTVLVFNPAGFWG